MRRKSSRGFYFFLIAILANAVVSDAQDVTIEPLKGPAIYAPGERAGWKVKLNNHDAQQTQYTFAIKKNNFDLIKSGQIDLTSGEAQIELTCDEPAMLLMELAPAGNKNLTTRPVGRGLIAGAAIGPTLLRPSAPRPKDFDSFWESKIQMLGQTPENAALTPGEAGVDGVEYATIKMDHINGAHVYGQLAKPANKQKLPALVIFQWASPPYPLQKSWVTSHAANGWLTLNIEPHNVLPDQPRSYYDALPESLKRYQSIGQDDRDKSYFLQMYLADYRAVDYITHRDDWDGKTLVVMGTSMGGQQSLCVAGLHPKITHVIVNEPAGCDTNGPLHGRQSGYPNFPANDPKVMETALYFDAVNFAPRIHAKCLVAMGFVDTIAPPAGIWTAFNQIPGPKQAVPMIDSPHNNLATPKQQEPFTSSSSQWLATLVTGGDVNPEQPTSKPSAATFDDHQNMMDQLGIRTLRPGPDPKNQGTFDLSTANRYASSMPDVLTMKDGTKVTRADQWPARRAQIAEDFEREIYGRIPANVPNVNWEVTNTSRGENAGAATVTRTLIGHVDTSGYPQLPVEIEASFTVPADARVAVPMMVAFAPRFPGRGPATRRASAGVPWTDQAITNGWGYGTINPASIQPDNNHLTSGIIGLTNKGQPRTPEQWGALRAWQWGVSRLIDCFEQHPEFMVDAKKVGIEGLSRYGKAAIVTEAFDTRVAVGLIGSSGEGGVKLHRHIFGEGVENLAGGEYYWMAGNFIKYGAADPLKTAADLPVDSHELIALCAPRPCFISYGVPEHGDPAWVDAQGSFMAGILASPVYELLGAHGFDIGSDYLTEAMPPVGQLVGGELAWRQHEGGHDVTPNWPAFFEWAGPYVQSKRQ